MASFTDTQMPNFNPYIQQQPVEAMVAVGTQKQKAYEQGVQKIQSQIDSIAGLDVARDVDKAYLQSKLNQLGNNLRTVAAGDFSNFQLVNSVGGMTKKVVSDPYIKAAVSSTAMDRKEMALLEEDRKKGALTPQAEYFYNLKRQKYYNSSELQNAQGNPVQYTGKYIQSWDIDKNMLDAIKAVGDSKWSADNVFKMVNGQIAKDKNGAPIYSDYAIREKKEGKFSENVEAAIDTVLNRPEAKQELTMRGIYNYRGYQNLEDFAKGYENEKKKTIKNYENKKFDMMVKVANAVDKNEKERYQAMVNALDSKIAETEQDAELKSSQALEFGSVEGYKAALETMKVKNSYMKSGVTEKLTSEIIENIPWKAQRQVVKEERDWQMQRDASARGWAAVQTAKDKLALDVIQWENDPKNPKNVNANVTPTVLGLGNPFITHHGALMDAVSSASGNMEATKFNVVSEYMAAVNAGNGRSVSKEQIQKDIKKYENDAPGFIDRMYGRAKKVPEDPRLARNPLYSGLVSLMPVAAMAEGELGRVSTTIKNMNNSPEVLAAGAKEVDLESVAKGFKPFTVEYVTDIDKRGTLLGGNKGFFEKPKVTKNTVNAQDAFDLAIIAKNTGGLGGIAGLFKTFTNSPAEQKQYEAANARIEGKFGIDGASLIRQTNALSYLDIVKGKADAKASPAAQGLFGAFQKVQNKKFDNVMAAKEKYLADNSLVPQPLAYNVYDVDMKGPERTSVDDRVKDVLNKYKSVGGLDEFQALYTDPKKFSAQITVDRGSTYAPEESFKLNLYDAGNLVKSIPVSREDTEYIKQTQLNLPARPSETAQRIQAGGGTTNASRLAPNNPDAYQGALIPGTYFSKKLNTTKVLGADVVQNPSGGFNAYLYTTDPSTGAKIGIPVKASKDDIYPANFTDADKATQFITTEIKNKAFVESLLNNGL